MRPQSSLGMLMEHMGWGLPLFNNFFHDLAAVLILEARRRVDVVWNGCKWMKWLGLRPVLVLGMLMEHVGWGLHKLNIFSHNFSTVAVFAAQALPSRLCRKWPWIDEMASYEVRIKSGKLIEHVGGILAQFNDIFWQFGRSWTLHFFRRCSDFFETHDS